jgi:hypothetical protein
LLLDEALGKREGTVIHAIGKRRGPAVIIAMTILVTPIALTETAGAAAAASPIPIPCHDVPALIAAVQTANEHPTVGTTIDLARSCTYRMTSIASQSDGGGNGLPVITGRITLNGHGSTILRKPKSPSFRILAVGSGGRISLNRVTLKGGLASAGAGLFNGQGGNAILNSSTVSFNIASNTGEAQGGGIDNQGAMTFNASAIRDNVARSASDVAEGAGIENDGEMVMNVTRVSSNLSRARADSAVAGGIDVGFGGLLTVNASRIDGNRTKTTSTPSLGAGIDSVGRVAINASRIDGNTSATDSGNASGAGVYDVGVMTLNASQVEHDLSLATGKGAPAVGGGITTSGMAINASDISRNTARSYDDNAEGGGLFALGGSSRLTLTNVSSNTASGVTDSGGGLFLVGVAQATLVYSSVAGNIPDNCQPPGRISGCTG